MKTAVIYSSRYLDHSTGFGHPESPDRLRAIISGIKSSAVLQDNCSLAAPREATLEEICAVHDKSYVKTVERFCSSGGGNFDEDTFLSPKSYEVALLAAGGAIKACELVMSREFDNGFALVRPPGHHSGVRGRALSASSLGFCVFNNVAIAAEALMKKFGLKHVMILDIDVHGGNGTQEIFYDRPEVLFVNLHQRGIYPGRCFVEEVGEGKGKGFNINVPLPPMASDDVYLKAYEEVIVPIASQFKPQFLLISAGFDGHMSDPLASMRLSDAGYIFQFEKALSIAHDSGAKGPVAMLEGGYNLDVLSRVITSVIATMSGAPIKADLKMATSFSDIVKEANATLKELKDTLSPYWKL